MALIPECPVCHQPLPTTILTETRADGRVVTWTAIDRERVEFALGRDHHLECLLDQDRR